MEQPHEEIELRSEKVRNLLGEIPPALVRWGTIIIVLIFVALIVVALLLEHYFSHNSIHIF